MATKEWKEKNKDKMREYRRKWYQKNKNKIDTLSKVRDRKLEILEWFTNLKTTFKCEQCGEEDSDCLDFHHLDPKLKEGNISTMVKRGWGKKRILEEISKCIILCANCHRKLHAKERREKDL